MRLTDKCSTYEFSCGLQKKHEYSMCSTVSLCSANITSWQLVRIISKQKWIKLLGSTSNHYYDSNYLKELAENWPFPRWNCFEVPIYGLLTMKIPTWAMRDTTLRTPWSKPPIVSLTGYHISPPSSLHWVQVVYSISWSTMQSRNWYRSEEVT